MMKSVLLHVTTSLDSKHESLLSMQTVIPMTTRQSVTLELLLKDVAKMIDKIEAGKTISTWEAEYVKEHLADMINLTGQRCTVIRKVDWQ
jgi:hypothetical protein